MRSAEYHVLEQLASGSGFKGRTSQLGLRAGLGFRGSGFGV